MAIPDDATPLEHVKKLLSQPEVSEVSGVEEVAESQPKEVSQVQDQKSTNESAQQVEKFKSVGQQIGGASTNQRQHLQTPILLLLLTYVIFSFPTDARIPTQANIALRSLLLVVMFTFGEKIY